MSQQSGLADVRTTVPISRPAVLEQALRNHPHDRDTESLPVPPGGHRLSALPHERPVPASASGQRIDPGAWAAPAASGPVVGRVAMPGSKSATNRALLLAALSPGTSTLKAPLQARDTLLMAQ